MDKLTTKSQEALAEAIRFATGTGNPQVGPLHLLAALLAQQSGAVMMPLDAVGVSRGEVEFRANAALAALPAPEGSSMQQLRAFRALSRAISDADKEVTVLGNAYTSTEHLLIAVAAPQSQAGETLQLAGAGREQLSVVLPNVRGNARVTSPDPEGVFQALEKYGTDLTAAAREGKMDSVIGRDSEIHHAVQALSRRAKSNPAFTGELGVGKTVVVEGLVQRIVDGDVSESLRDKRLIQPDVVSVMAGVKYRDEFEECFKVALQETKDLAGETVTFIDETHTTVGAGGGSEGAMDAGNILKLMLARGKLRLVGAITLDEYREGIEKDPALERRLQQVYMGEPSVEDTVAILHGIAPKHGAHHKVTISDGVLVTAATPSNHHIPGRQLPDKAIDPVDEAASHLHMELDSSPEEIDALQRQMDRLKMKEAYLVETETRDDVAVTGRPEKPWTEPVDKSEELAVLNARQEPEKAGRNRVGEPRVKLDESRTELERAAREGRYEDTGHLQNGDIPAIEAETTEAEMQELAEADADTEPMIVERADADEIAEVTFAWTGVSAGKLLQGETEKLLSMEDVLGKQLIDQKNVMASVSDVVRRSRVGVADPSRPLGPPLPLGPMGASETELAKSLAEFMFGDDRVVARIDMSKYSEKHSVSCLVDASPGYVGYEEGGQLTEAVRRRPYSVILLDEVEKANPDVFDILLQVLDDSCLTSGQGRTVDFKNTILILTSNLGSQAFMDPTLDESQKYEAVMALVRETLGLEFIDQLGDVIVPDPLSLEELGKIVDLQVEQVAWRLKPWQIALDMTDAVGEFLAMDGYDPAYGAHPLRWLVQYETGDRLARMLFSGEATDGATVTVDTDPSDSTPGLKLTAREQRCGWWLVKGRA